MFTKCYPNLMSYRRIDALVIPRASGISLQRARDAAVDALQNAPGAMLLSERLRHPAEYHAVQRRRRDALLSLLPVDPSPEILLQVTDLICAITEEPTWSLNPQNTPFEDDNHPVIDLQSAETAVLLGWTAHILGSRLDACVVSRMYCEVRRRILRPTLAHKDYDFMSGKGACPMAVCADILLTALFLERDEIRLSQLVRSALKLLDEARLRHGRELVPLTDALIEISAVTDLVQILAKLTESHVDLTSTLPTIDWLDELLCPWIQDDLFVDPAGSGMQTALSGSDIFRIGCARNDNATILLGAYLHHRAPRPSATVTGRLMDPAYSERLENTVDRPLRLSFSALRNYLLMTARIPGLHCVLHVGGGRGNAGDVCLFSEGVPVLVDGGREASHCSVPIIAGMRQLARPSRPCIADSKEQNDRDIMSVDLTHAYPAECGLNSYQRTLLTLRDEKTVRIVDALNLNRPAPVVFNFVCASRPTVLSSAVRMGAVRMTWEGDFEAKAIPMSGGLTRLELTCAEPVQNAFFTFNFEFH